MQCKCPPPIAQFLWGSCRWDRQTDIEQDIVQCRLYVGCMCCAGLDAGWQVTYSARSVCLWILSYMCTAQWCGHSRLRYGTGRHWHSPFQKRLMGTLQNQNNVTIHPMIDMGRHSPRHYWVSEASIQTYLSFEIGTMSKTSNYTQCSLPLALTPFTTIILPVDSASGSIIFPRPRSPAKMAVTELGQVILHWWRYLECSASIHAELQTKTTRSNV